MSDVRKLFSANKREKEKAKAKRIEGKFVKYDSLGRLWCSLCEAQIKHESLWNAHLASKTHKDKLKPPPTKPTTTQPATLVAYNDDADADDDDDEVDHSKQPDNTAANGLPPGFFDSPAGSPATSDAAAKLPQGFFDAPPTQKSDIPASSQSTTSKDAASTLPLNSSQQPQKSSKPSSSSSSQPSAAPSNPALPTDFFQGSAALVAHQARESHLAAELARFTSEIRADERKLDDVQERDEEEMLGARDVGLEREQREMMLRLEELKRKRKEVERALGGGNGGPEMAKGATDPGEQSDDQDDMEEDLPTVPTRSARAALFLPGPADLPDPDVDSSDDVPATVARTLKPSLKKRRVETATIPGGVRAKRGKKEKPKVLKSIFGDGDEAEDDE
ncbi:hypothetical protein M427DRAFT_41574 [Gonapodya prolifera JEL478]|uniref:C2H2-type domain-containing protein n=1 Tax=Gonapodya prolifera (strain JEL478) TaxID=1344416 RepID=A0A139AUD2_GONPJ|nr:hypothetical protein M427DRAFT_41574 [Gonapodya prolifera JEL478]|eukprot:KXS20328.1 hypothetical protein M427DRAFT_41574 [Gonapodya prolifera JEL478]